jgi:hypothetical protein
MLCLVFALGCSRKAGKTATISIQFAKNSDQKVSASSTYSSTLKACYGLSVTGPGITANSSTCSPPIGVTAGFVAAGGAIEATVPYGTKRRFDVFLYLEKEGENNPCPQLGTAFSKEQLAQTYLIGTADNVSIDQPSVSISITENFPGVANTIATNFALPASCTAAPTSTTARRSLPGFRVNTGGGYASSGAVQLYGHIGRVNSGPELTGGGIKMVVRSAGGK